MICLAVILMGGLSHSQASIPFPRQNSKHNDSFAKTGATDGRWLPEAFKVYVSDQGSVGDCFPNESDSHVHILPTYNDYKGRDGGYIALYTHEKSAGVYSVGDGIYVVGQIRCQGHYDGTIFIPKGKDGVNISKDSQVIALSEQHFPQLKGKVWAGGDTGGW